MPEEKKELSAHSLLGRQGEEMAAAYLEREGYRILERNWRFEKSEVDIIARLDDLLVFVEVKSRGEMPAEDPLDSVHEKKESMLARAADRYLENFMEDCEYRFDIITVIFHQGGEEITHYPGAFVPGKENEYEY